MSSIALKTISDSFGQVSESLPQPPQKEEENKDIFCHVRSINPLGICNLDKQYLSNLIQRQLGFLQESMRMSHS